MLKVEWNICEALNIELQEYKHNFRFHLLIRYESDKVYEHWRRIILMYTVAKASKLQFDPRSQIANLFADGFMQWLAYFSKDRETIAKAFAHMFVLEQFYVAVDGNRIAGMIGCTDGYTPSINLDKKELKRYFGFIKGTFGGFFLKKEFEGGIENPSPDKGSIEFVGTASEYRGQGIATSIFNYILENTPYMEYVIDEVADTNIAAMNLYQKWGFTEYKRKPVPQNRAKKIGINNLISLKYCKKG